VKLTWQRIDLHLHHPFRTAAAVRTHKQTIWVRFRHDGLEGWGEAAPADLYGQSLDSAERTLTAIANHLPSQPEPIEPLIDLLLTEFDGQRAPAPAIDAALHDWRARSNGLSVVNMLGLDPTAAPPTSVTLGIDSPQNLAVKMGELADFPIWKVKIGTDS